LKILALTSPLFGPLVDLRRKSGLAGRRVFERCRKFYGCGLCAVRGVRVITGD
jgi:hypothetical protein